MNPASNGKAQQLKSMASKDRCFIVGSGSSLKGFDFSAIENEFTIAVNHSIRYFNNANVLVFLDYRLVQEIKQTIDEFPGIIYASWKSGYMDKENAKGLYHFAINNKQIHLDIEQGLYSGELSGMCAIHLALIAGFKEIYLLGFDLMNEGSSYFFEDEFKEKGRVYEDRKIKRCLKLFRKMAEYNDRVFNCSKDSIIPGFEYRDPNEVIK